MSELCVRTVKSTGVPCSSNRLSWGGEIGLPDPLSCRRHLTRAERLAFNARGTLNTKQCADCKEELPVSEFYWVSKASGILRGQCKNCMRRRKAEQLDPEWVPGCSRCGHLLLTRSGSGRRLCETCAAETYDLSEPPCGRGGRRVKLKSCTLCRGPKELFERGKLCHACKPWALYAKSLRRFGITPVEYVAILQAQGGVCYLCGIRPEGKRLCIDHDHALPDCREAVRGLLCDDCNYSRLPRFNEDPVMLLRAVEYLTVPPARLILSPQVALADVA